MHLSTVHKLSLVHSSIYLWYTDGLLKVFYILIDYINNINTKSCKVVKWIKRSFSTIIADTIRKLQTVVIKCEI